MWPFRFWALRYWPQRFWGKVGGIPIVVETYGIIATLSDIRELGAITDARETGALTAATRELGVIT